MRARDRSWMGVVAFLIMIGLCGLLTLTALGSGCNRGGQLREIEVTNGFRRAIAVDHDDERLTDLIEPGETYRHFMSIYRGRFVALTALDPATGRILARLDLEGPALARIDDGETIRVVIGP